MPPIDSNSFPPQRSRFETADAERVAQRVSIIADSTDGQELMRQIAEQHNSIPRIGGILSVEYRGKKWYVIGYNHAEIIIEPPFFERPADRREANRREAVNHPLHYGGDVPHEVWKCLHAWGLEEDAMLWNAVKYIARASKKDSTIEDLKKAQWYLNKRIELLEKKL